MASINLVINQYVSKNHRSHGTISLQKSNSNSNYVAAIPYHMQSYTPLIDYLSPLVLPEWQAEMERLFAEERAATIRRQEAMISYKKQLAELLPPLIEQFKIEHPEEFI